MYSPNPKIENLDDMLASTVERHLLRYGVNGAFSKVSELDGFFAAVISAPQNILPSQWLPIIWGDEFNSLDSNNDAEISEFCAALLCMYNNIVDYLGYENYLPSFSHELNAAGTPVMDAGKWSAGFLRGLAMWGDVEPADQAVLEHFLHPIRQLDSCEAQLIDAAGNLELEQIQTTVGANVVAIYQHFFKSVKFAASTYVTPSPKIGRNEACPCGSGKKYKKCCGAN